MNKERLADYFEQAATFYMAIYSFISSITHTGEYIGPHMMVQPNTLSENYFMTRSYHFIIALGHACAYGFEAVTGMQLHIYFQQFCANKQDVYEALLVFVVINQVIPYYIAIVASLAVGVIDLEYAWCMFFFTEAFKHRHEGVYVLSIVCSNIVLSTFGILLIYATNGFEKRQTVYRYFCSVSFAASYFFNAFGKPCDYNPLTSLSHFMLGFLVADGLLKFQVEKRKLENSFMGNDASSIFIAHFKRHYRQNYEFKNVLLFLFCVLGLYCIGYVENPIFKMLLHTSISYLLTYTTCIQLLKYGLSERPPFFYGKWCFVFEILQPIYIYYACLAQTVNGVLFKLLSFLELGPYNNSMLFLLFFGALSMQFTVSLISESFFSPGVQVAQTIVQKFYQQEKRDGIARFLLMEEKSRYTE